MKRDLRLFYLYRLLVTAHLFVPAQVKFYQERHLSWTKMFVLNSVFSLILVAFEVPTGALADRIGRRWAMVLGSTLMAGAFLIYFASSAFRLFVLAETICALGMTLTSGPDSAYLFDLAQDEGRVGSYSRFEGTASSFKYIGMAVAAMAGGFIAQHNTALTYLGASGMCLLAALVAARLREAPPSRRMREQRWGGYVPHMSRALRTALGGRRLRYAILYSSFIFVLLRISLWLYQPYLSEAGYDVAAIGLVFGLLYAVAALCSHFVDAIRARLPNGSIYWCLPAVLCVSYLLLGPRAAFWGIGLMFAQKVVDGLYSPITKELLNREITDSSQRASVLSVESMVRRIAFTLFAPSCGLLMDHYGRPGAFYLCALVGGLGAGALLLRGRAAARLQAGQASLTAGAAGGRFNPL